MTRLESPEEASARLESETLTEVERTELWERIRARTAESAGARRPIRVVALAALALSAAAFAVLVLRHGDPSTPLGSLRRGNTSRPAPATCALDGRNDRIALPPSCPAATVRVGGDEWLVSGGAEVTRFDGGVRLHRGQVQFHVEHRADTHFYVQVSHGEVRVVGTRFEVRQTADDPGKPPAGEGGSVSVSEGAIEFLWLDGSKERVSVGQTLTWPRRVDHVELAAPVPTASASDRGPDTALRRPVHDASSKTRHPEGPSEENDLGRVMDRLLQLKSQHRYTEVVTLLETTLGTQKLGGVQRERLSYELGLALEATGRSACAHWKRHVQRFGSGAHAAALAERLKKCDGI